VQRFSARRLRREQPTARRWIEPVEMTLGCS
jgi:hypothetical protein